MHPQPGFFYEALQGLCSQLPNKKEEGNAFLFFVNQMVTPAMSRIVGTFFSAPMAMT